MAFTVTYDGNGSDGGSVPVDTNTYNPGDTVTVVQPPAGSMTKSGATFAYWNTAPNGTGTLFGYPTVTTFPMPNANVTLYAQWFVTTGLNNAGATNYYQFSYDSSLRASGVEPGRTQTVMKAADDDYDIMSGWFAGVTASGPTPIPVYVTRLTGGARNTGPITVMPNTNDPNDLRCDLVSEVTESFMHGQNKGWGFLPGVGNEESCGEALSLFLTQQFALLRGFPNPYTSFTANTANGWLNTSLPKSNPSSTRFKPDPNCTQVTDWGSRADYVNSVLPCFGNGPGTGCSILFIYYLFSQLGFSKISHIIANAPGFTNGVLNAPSPLRGVYQNLTADTTDPFLTFKSILDTSFPGESVITAENPDNPFPLPSGAELSTVQYLRKNAPGTKNLRQLITSKGFGNLRAVLNSDRPTSLVK